MNTLTTRLGWGLAAVLLGIGAAGCSSHSQNTGTGSKTVAQLGAEMEKGGVMSQSDYIKQVALAHAVSQSHTITDTDLTWTLAQLTEEKNPVARARAFTILAAIRPVPAVQKSRILPAITPYLSSSDRLDQAGAQLVQRKVQAAG